MNEELHSCTCVSLHVVYICALNFDGFKMYYNMNIYYYQCMRILWNSRKIAADMQSIRNGHNRTTAKTLYPPITIATKYPTTTTLQKI